MGIRAHCLQIRIHGKQDVARPRESRADAFLQGFDAPALPEEAVAPPGTKIGDAQARKFAQALDLGPHLGLGAGVKHVEGEIADGAHGRTRTQFIDDCERRNFPERRFHPGTVEGQFVLTVALGKLVFGKLQIAEPCKEFGFEDLGPAIESIAREPDHFLLGETQRPDMIELLAQLLLVDLIGETDRGGAVDQGESGVDLWVELPDHLKHQELVEVGIDKAADDRIELPGVVVNPGRDICLGHDPLPSLPQQELRRATGTLRSLPLQLSAIDFGLSSERRARSGHAAVTDPASGWTAACSRFRWKCPETVLELSVATHWPDFPAQSSCPTIQRESRPAWRE